MRNKNIFFSITYTKLVAPTFQFLDRLISSFIFVFVFVFVLLGVVCTIVYAFPFPPRKGGGLSKPHTYGHCLYFFFCFPFSFFLSVFTSVPPWNEPWPPIQ